MLECCQFAGMNVYEHGLNVHQWFKDLQKVAFYADCAANNLRIPAWFASIWKCHLFTWDSGPGFEQEWETIRLYQIYHDCGKPFCRVIDEHGRQHFPNHAEVSYQTWIHYAETEQDYKVGNLIHMDMDAHTVKGNAIDEFIRRPEAPILVLTGLAEIYSNASHLNQIDSDAFKIKYKQLDKVGKRLLAHLQQPVVV